MGDSQRPPAEQEHAPPAEAGPGGQWSGDAAKGDPVALSTAAAPASDAGSTDRALPYAGLTCQQWVCVAGVLVVGLAVAYLARAVLIPVAGAVLLSLTLSPMIRWLNRRGVPRSLGALFFAVTVSAAGVFVLITIGSLLSSWAEAAPQFVEKIEQRLAVFSGPLDPLSEATQDLADGRNRADTPGGDDEESSAEPRDPAAEPQASEPASFADPGLVIQALSAVLSQSISILAGAFICVVLTFFLLLSGDVFLAKLLSLFPQLRDKKQVMGVVREIEAGLSRFIGLWTLVNAAVGLVVWGAFVLIGVPNAWVWGIAAMLSNYVPYAGPWTLGAVALVMGVMTFDDYRLLFLPVLVILVVNVVEGFFVSPMLHGRRLNLNTVAVFLAVVLGGWLWGIAGALMAVPALVVAYVICANIPAFRPVALFLDDSAPGLNRGADDEKGDATSHATPSLDRQTDAEPA